MGCLILSLPNLVNGRVVSSFSKELASQERGSSSPYLDVDLPYDAMPDINMLDVNG
jgi:hypothetical protein